MLHQIFSVTDGDHAGWHNLQLVGGTLMLLKMPVNSTSLYLVHCVVSHSAPQHLHAV